MSALSSDPAPKLGVRTTTPRPAMTDPQKPKLHESFYSVFSAVFSCIMLGLVAYLAYDWLQG